MLPQAPCGVHCSPCECRLTHFGGSGARRFPPGKYIFEIRSEGCREATCGWDGCCRRRCARDEWWSFKILLRWYQKLWWWWWWWWWWCRAPPGNAAQQISLFQCLIFLEIAWVNKVILWGTNANVVRLTLKVFHFYYLKERALCFFIVLFIYFFEIPLR